MVIEWNGLLAAVRGPTPARRFAPTGHSACGHLRAVMELPALTSAVLRAAPCRRMYPGRCCSGAAPGCFVSSIPPITTNDACMRLFSTIPAVVPARHGCGRASGRRTHLTRARGRRFDQTPPPSFSGVGFWFHPAAFPVSCFRNGVPGPGKSAVLIVATPDYDAPVNDDPLQEAAPVRC
jgi:hypothetical protein